MSTQIVILMANESVHPTVTCVTNFVHTQLALCQPNTCQPDNTDPPDADDTCNPDCGPFGNCRPDCEPHD